MTSVHNDHIGNSKNNNPELSPP